MRAPFALALGTLALAGCLATAPLGLDDWAGLDAAGRRAVALRLLDESDVTAFSGRRYELLVPGTVPVPVAGGFIPGRVPGRRTELVVVPVALDGPYAPALLDAATVLAARARYGQSPERSVLVGFWPERGRPADVLALPVWPASRPRTVLRVTDGSSRTPDATLPDRLAAVTVTLPRGLPRDSLSARLQRAIVAAAAAPSPDSSDTDSRP